MSAIDDYLKSVTTLQGVELQKIRKIIKQIIPEINESISYGVPAFKYKNKPVIYFAAYKNHMSLYPASDEMIEEVGDSLDKFRTSKGTFRFTEKNPIPEATIKKIVKYRLNNLKT